MSLRDQMEEIYRDVPSEQIPWNLEEPPEVLSELVRTEKIEPCDAVDVVNLVLVWPHDKLPVSILVCRY